MAPGGISENTVISVDPGPALLGPGPERAHGLGFTSSFCFQEAG